MNKKFLSILCITFCTFSAYSMNDQEKRGSIHELFVVSETITQEMLQNRTEQAAQSQSQSNALLKCHWLQACALNSGSYAVSILDSIFCLDPAARNDLLGFLAGIQGIKNMPDLSSQDESKSLLLVSGKLIALLQSANPGSDEYKYAKIINNTVQEVQHKYSHELLIPEAKRLIKEVEEKHRTRPCTIS